MPLKHSGELGALAWPSNSAACLAYAPFVGPEDLNRLARKRARQDTPPSAERMRSSVVPFETFMFDRSLRCKIAELT